MRQCWFLVTSFVWKECDGLRDWGARRSSGNNFNLKLGTKCLFYGIVSQQRSRYLDILQDNLMCHLWISGLLSLKDRPTLRLCDNTNTSQTPHTFPNLITGTISWRRGLGSISCGWEPPHYSVLRCWECTLMEYLVGCWEYGCREKACRVLCSWHIIPLLQSHSILQLEGMFLI